MFISEWVTGRTSVIKEEKADGTSPQRREEEGKVGCHIACAQAQGSEERQTTVSS